MSRPDLQPSKTTKGVWLLVIVSVVLLGVLALATAVWDAAASSDPATSERQLAAPQRQTAKDSADPHHATARPRTPENPSARSAGALPGGLHGEVLWAEHEPVKDALVVVVSTDGSSLRSRTNAIGKFHVAEYVPPGSVPERVTLTIRPRCWRRGRRFTVPAREEGARRTRLVEPVMLPSEFDLDVEVAVSADLLHLLHDHGVEHARVSIVEAVPHRPAALLARRSFAEVSMSLASLGLGRASRLPYQRLINGILWFEGDLFAQGGSFEQQPVGRQMIAEELLSIERDRVPRLRFELGLRNVLMGTVVDHLGQPLAEALVELRKPRADLPSGFSRNRQTPGVTGKFLYFDDPAAKLDVAASYLGVETVVEDVTMGRTDLRITMDLSARTPVQVRMGAQAVTRFRISNAPYLFCVSRLPPLPLHAGGKAWLPGARRADAEWLMIAWLEEGLYYETTLRRPLPGPDGVAVIDLAEAHAPPCGTLEVAFGDLQNVLIDIERIDPPPPHRRVRLWRLVGSGGRASRKVYGIQPGRYRIQVKKAQAWPGTSPLVEVFRDFHGADRLDVPTLR